MNEPQKNDIISDVKNVIDTMSESEKNPVADAPTKTEDPKENTPAKAKDTVAAQKPFEPSDELVERAVKAGLTLADAKSFSSAEAMDRILAALESRTPAPEKTDKGDDSPADIDLSELSEDEFDPRLVKALKALKEQNDALRKSRDDDRRARISAQAQQDFDKRVAGLGEDVTAHLDAASKSKLQRKYELLKKAYDGDKSVTEDTIFSEAAELAIGDLMARAKAEGKSAKLSARRNLALARPGGDNGQKSRTSGKGDAVSETVAAIVQEFGLI